MAQTFQLRISVITYEVTWNRMERNSVYQPCTLILIEAKHHRYAAERLPIPVVAPTMEHEYLFPVSVPTGITHWWKPRFTTLGDEYLLLIHEWGGIDLTSRGNIVQRKLNSTVSFAFSDCRASIISLRSWVRYTCSSNTLRSVLALWSCSFTSPLRWAKFFSHRIPSFVATSCCGRM